jgi:recombinational DNA repair protein (RecF pathway)
MTAVKRCPRCGQRKPADQFYRRRGSRTSPYCQPCQRATTREHQRRRQDPAAAERLRAVDRTRQRRRRALRRQPPPGGDAA